MEKIIESLANQVKTYTGRSTWSKAVEQYAIELLDGIDEQLRYGYAEQSDIASPALLKKLLLNGADNWQHYSWGGCSLCYNYDIAERVCTPSELKKHNGGAWKPNRYEEWLDVQARALEQASRRILRAAKVIAE